MWLAIKRTFYSLVAMLSVFYFNISSAIDAWLNKGTWADNPGWANNIETTVENILTWVISFLYLIAVIFGIYAWFRILTAWWDEEKVKKWKTTLINVAIWIIVIFLVSVVIRWLIQVLSSDAVT